MRMLIAAIGTRIRAKLVHERRCCHLGRVMGHEGGVWLVAGCFWQAWVLEIRWRLSAGHFSGTMGGARNGETHEEGEAQSTH